MEVQLKETERIDDLQLKGLKLIQDTTGFCFGIDAVLLANFAKVKKGAKVVDLGTGTGIIPTLIAGKSEASKGWLTLSTGFQSIRKYFLWQCNKCKTNLFLTCIPACSTCTGFE